MFCTMEILKNLLKLSRFIDFISGGKPICIVYMRLTTNKKLLMAWPITDFVKGYAHRREAS